MGDANAILQQAVKENLPALETERKLFHGIDRTTAADHGSIATPRKEPREAQSCLWGRCQRQRVRIPREVLVTANSSCKDHARSFQHAGNLRMQPHCRSRPLVSRIRNSRHIYFRHSRESGNPLALKINGFRLAPGSAGLAGMTAIYATNLRNTSLAPSSIFRLLRADRSGRVGGDRRVGLCPDARQRTATHLRRSPLMICHDACPGSRHSQKVQPFVGFFVTNTAAAEGVSNRCPLTVSAPRSARPSQVWPL